MNPHARALPELSFDPHSNTLAHTDTTSSLPTEILQDIFVRSAHDHYYEKQDSITLTVPCWVNVSYVCRRWRNVALWCPALWTYIFIVSQRWTEELLHRSKQASLKICCQPWVRPFEWWNSLEKLLNHAERIQELCVWPSSLARTQYVLFKLSSRTPRLQSLSILAEQIFYPRSTPDAQRDTPALRTLVLSSCPVQLQSFQLESLTYFRLHNVPQLFRIHVEQFLDVLRCMKNLESLFLWDTFPSVTSLSPAVSRVSEEVSLPHLSRFSIEGRLSTISAFLSSVNIPLKSTVLLQLDGSITSSFDDHDLFYPILAKRYRLAEALPVLSPMIRSLVLDMNFLMHPSFTCSTHERDFTAVSFVEWEQSDFPFQIDWYPRGHSVVMKDIVVNVCRCLPLSNVRSCYVAEPPFSSVFWREILGCLPDIRYIKLDRGYMPDLSILSPLDLAPGEDMQNQDVPASGDGSLAQVMAPLLEELELEDIIFSGGNSDLPEPAMTCRSLFNALSKRQGSRGRLTMTECMVGARRVDLVMEWGNGDVYVLGGSAPFWIEEEEQEG